ncbi:hypothetical protein IG631_16706 [Alternaria alternata]|nr:hypothetical protein IG631_16706 [Alternaria alternata]
MKSITIFLVFGSMIGTQAALTERRLNSVCSEVPHLAAVAAQTDHQILEQCQLESKIITQLKSNYAQAASTYCSSFIAKSTTTTVSTTPIVTTTLTPVSTLATTPTSTATVGTDTTITSTITTTTSTTTTAGTTTVTASCTPPAVKVKRDEIIESPNGKKFSVPDGTPEKRTAPPTPSCPAPLKYLAARAVSSICSCIVTPTTKTSTVVQTFPAATSTTSTTTTPAATATVAPVVVGGGSCGCSYTSVCGTQYVDTGAGVYITQASSLQQCIQQCDENFLCSEYSFQYSTGVCTQLHGGYNAVANADFASGTIATGGGCAGNVMPLPMISGLKGRKWHYVSTRCFGDAEMRDKLNDRSQKRHRVWVKNLSQLKRGGWTDDDTWICGLEGSTSGSQAPSKSEAHGFASRTPTCTNATAFHLDCQRVGHKTLYEHALGYLFQSPNTPRIDRLRAPRQLCNGYLGNGAERHRRALPHTCVRTHVAHMESSPNRGIHEYYCLRHDDN